MVRNKLVGMAAAVAAASALTASPVASTVVAGAPAHSARCASAPADARVPHGVVPTRDPNTLTAAQADAMESRSARMIGNTARLAARENGSVSVPVHVHVIQRDDGSGGVVPQRVQRQIAVLNDAYSGAASPEGVDTPFRFHLDSIDYTRNSDWARMDFEDSQAARRALRVGDSTHLNVYVTGFGGDLNGLLGFATFPERYEKAPLLDGVVVWRASLPGGRAVFQDSEGTVFNYAMGDTLTHEVGHWLNLYHTFQGGCGDRNDFVSDTEPQAPGENIFYCNPDYNTCGGPNSDTDPVENYMNYVDDRCMDRFTFGQRDRMNISWYIREAMAG